jgi:hypothetical protein
MLGDSVLKIPDIDFTLWLSRVILIGLVSGDLFYQGGPYLRSTGGVNP